MRRRAKSERDVQDLVAMIEPYIRATGLRETARRMGVNPGKVHTWLNRQGKGGGPTALSIARMCEAVGVRLVIEEVGAGVAGAAAPAVASPPPAR